MSELRRALTGCLLGGLLVLWGSSRTWVRVELPSAKGLFAPVVSGTGRQLYPSVTAMAWVALAGVLALVAVRGWARQLVGAVLAAAGVVVVVQCGLALRDTRLPADSCGGARACFSTSNGTHFLNGWVLLTLAGGLLLAVVGLLVAVRGGGWAGLGASYDAPGAAPPPPATDKGVWDALDRGDDPTA